MSLLDNIRNKPPAVKMRLMWTVAIIVAVLLIAVWIISYKFHRNTAEDTSLFQTIGQGIHNLKINYKK